MRADEIPIFLDTDDEDPGQQQAAWIRKKLTQVDLDGIISLRCVGTRHIERVEVKRYVRGGERIDTYRFGEFMQRERI